MLELGALRWGWDNMLALCDDRERVVKYRCESGAEQLLPRNLNALADPRPEPVGSGCQRF